MIEGEMIYKYQDNIEDWMKRWDNLHDHHCKKFVFKYLLYDYDTFINTRTKELNIKNNFLLNIKKMFSINFSFYKSKDDWFQIFRVMKQTYLFTNSDMFKLDRDDSFFTINEKKFNILKKAWQPYIEYIINRDIRLKTQLKINSF